MALLVLQTKHKRQYHKKGTPETQKLKYIVSTFCYGVQNCFQAQGLNYQIEHENLDKQYKHT